MPSGHHQGPRTEDYLVLAQEVRLTSGTIKDQGLRTTSLGSRLTSGTTMRYQEDPPSGGPG